MATPHCAWVANTAAGARRRLSAAAAAAAAAGGGANTAGGQALRREPRPLSRTTSINSGSTLEHEVAVPKKAELVKSMVGGNVHSSYNAQRERDVWMKKPLFNREGESSFASGADAARRLQQEAIRKDPYQFDLHDSINDITQSIVPLFEKQPRFAWVMKQLMEPERTITFRVKWVDDDNNMRINRGYRVQYSSALGPYRGGLRFSSRMNHGQMRMHGFEKTMKSALSGEPWGGSSGGADLNVAGKSPDEMRRFCLAFVQALGPFLGGKDLLEPGPAVGPKEMDVMLAGYRKEFDPTATERTLFAPEGFRKQTDTGRGAAFMAEHALARAGLKGVRGMRCAITGCDSRAFALARSLIDLGAAPVSFTDATGSLVQASGFDAGEVQQLESLLSSRGKLAEFRHVSAAANFFDVTSGQTVWTRCKGVADLAFPTQDTNEINADDAAALVEGGLKGVFEVSDRACSANAVGVLESHKAVFAPSKLVTAVGSDQDLSAHFASLLDAVATASSGVGCDPGNLKVGASVLAFSRVAASRMYS